MLKREVSIPKIVMPKNKRTLIFVCLTLFLVLNLYLSNTFSQDLGLSLPEGATASLGKGTIEEIKYSPDGTRLAVAGSFGIRLYDAQTGEELDLLIGHAGIVNSVSFSPDGRTLASGGFDATIRLWDVRTGELLRILTGHTDDIDGISFSPDGRTLASGGFDATIRLWDVRTGRLLETLTGHRGIVYSVSFSPDSKTLASGGRDATIRLWDVRTGRLLRTLIGHTAGWISSISFSPDGRTLASGGRDATIRLWDVRTGRLLRTLIRHTRWVRSVSFSPDGWTLASGSSDATIRLWDVRTGRHLRTLIGHTAGVYSVSFNPDGWTLASGSGNGTVLLWGTIPMAPAAPSQLLIALNKENLINANSRPLETSLLANYPNPFNPETWMPYQLASPAEVRIVIYAADGQVIRKLDLGYQPMGFYESRSRAAYWDGKNAVGEPVASGVYFYTFTAGDFTATRRMLILK